VSADFRLAYAGAVRALRAQADEHAYRELALSPATRLDSNWRRIVAMRWTFRASALAVLTETIFWIA